MTQRIPSVSIIFPIHNEAAFLEQSFGAILSQDYPANSMEILIMDGKSTDNSREIVVALAAFHPQISFRLLNNPGKFVPTAMNIALRQARGDIIIRVDGHTIIASDYVRQCVDAIQRTHADNVGGKMNAIGSSPFGKAVAVATSTPFGIGGGRFHYSDKEEWVDTVYLGAWPRQVFERIGLFDEELVRNQDDEFNYRLREQGGRILLSPAIHSEYTTRSFFTTLWHQYYQYGFWKVRVMQKHPHQMRPRQFVPPAFVLALIGSTVLAISSLAISSRLLLLLSAFIPLLYMLTNLLASIFTAFVRGGKYLILLPFIFAILHLSYGLGFLSGLRKFIHRWKDKQGRRQFLITRISNYLGGD